MGFTKFANPSVNPTITLDAYTANDVVGGLLQFDVSALAVNGGLINQAKIVDIDNQKETYRLILFEAAPATIANDAAYAPVAADLYKQVANITFAAAAYVTDNSLAFCFVEDINNVFVTTDGILYGYLVATDTPDMATLLGLTIQLWVVSEQ